MSNAITIELSKEDRKLLEGLMGSVSLLASVIANAQPTEVQKKIIAEVTGPQVAETYSAADENPATAPIVEEVPAPAAEEIPETEPVTFAEFQKAVTLAVAKSPEAKKAVKALIHKYATSVSAVPEDKRAEVMAELENI